MHLHVFNVVTALKCRCQLLGFIRVCIQHINSFDVFAITESPTDICHIFQHDICKLKVFTTIKSMIQVCNSYWDIYSLK